MKKDIIFKGLVKSHKKDKKWDALFTVDGRDRVVPFGARGYRDFTLLPRRTALEKKMAEHVRALYIQRHSRMGEDWNDPLTPGALSRWLLWQEPTLESAETEYRRRFGL